MSHLRCTSNSLRSERSDQSDCEPHRVPVQSAQDDPGDGSTAQASPPATQTRLGDHLVPLAARFAAAEQPGSPTFSNMLTSYQARHSWVESPASASPTSEVCGSEPTSGLQDGHMDLSGGGGPDKASELSEDQLMEKLGSVGRAAAHVQNEQRHRANRDAQVNGAPPFERTDHATGVQRLQKLGVEFVDVVESLRRENTSLKDENEDVWAGNWALCRALSQLEREVETLRGELDLATETGLRHREERASLCWGSGPNEYAAGDDRIHPQAPHTYSEPNGPVSEGETGLGDLVKQ